MSTLLKWKESLPLSIEHGTNPFLNLQEEVDKVFRNFHSIFEPKSGLGQFENLELLPSMDLVEDKDNYIVQVEMPGMDEKDIKVSFSDNILTITGEKSTSTKNKDKKYISREISYGKCERTISLPTTVDTTKAKATFKKGMLWVVLPKKTQTQGSSHNIKIEQA